MTVSTLSAFERRLQEGASVVLIIAEEFLCQKEALALIPPSEEVTCLEGDKLKSELLMQELESQSLFASQRRVEIRGAENLSKAVVDYIAGYCEAPSPQLTLVLVASSLPPSSTLRRAAEVVLHLAPLKHVRDAVAWVEQTGTVAPGVAEVLVQRVSMDRSLLKQELEKLAAYAGWSRPVTAEDVRLLCSPSRAQTVWELARAILERDAARAMRALQEQQQSPFALLGQLRSQLQTALHVCALMEQGGGEQAVAQSYPYLQGRRLSETVQRARTFGPVRLRRALALLFVIEHQCKSVQTSPERLMELFVAKVTR